MLPCGLNYVGVRLANIVIGVTCLTLELYVRQKSFFKDDVDVVFIFITGFCALEALLFMISLRSNHNVELIWRFVCCLALVGVGTLLVHSALSIQRFCQQLPPEIGLLNCQLFEMKITVGVLAILNGIIYPLAKFSRSDGHGGPPFDIYSEVSDDNNHLVPPSRSPTASATVSLMSAGSISSTKDLPNVSPGLASSNDSSAGQFCQVHGQGGNCTGGRGWSGTAHKHGHTRGGHTPSPPQPINYPRGYHPHVPLGNHSTWENQHTNSRFPYPVLRT